MPTEKFYSLWLDGVCPRPNAGSLQAQISSLQRIVIPK